MATKVITYPSFKRGDTPTFRFTFSPPVAGFSWSGVTVDIAMTNQSNPLNNSAAAAVVTNLTPSVDSSNLATVSLTLTAAQSNSLIPGNTYYVEPQLKQGNLVNTPVSGKVLIEQDYVI